MRYLLGGRAVQHEVRKFPHPLYYAEARLVELPSDAPGISNRLTELVEQGKNIARNLEVMVLMSASLTLAKHIMDNHVKGTVTYRDILNNTWAERGVPYAYGVGYTQAAWEKFDGSYAQYRLTPQRLKWKPPRQGPLQLETLIFPVRWYDTRIPLSAAGGFVTTTRERMPELEEGLYELLMKGLLRHLA